MKLESPLQSAFLRALGASVSAAGSQKPNAPFADRMKTNTLLMAGLALALLGCGEKPEAASPETAASSSPSLPSLALPSLEPNAPAGQARTSAVPAPPAAPPAVDFTAADRPLNERGQPLSDVELLNDALEAYRSRVMSAVTIPQRTYKTQEEENAATTAAYEAVAKRVKFRDVSELVKAGVIKAVPAAPPGKKYAIDPTTGRVILVSQK